MAQPDFEKTPFLACVANVDITPVVDVRSEGPVLGTLLKKKNRRAWVRWPCDLEAFCQPHPVQTDRLWWLGRVRKISRGGISLLLSLQLDVGTLLEVELHTRIAAFSRTLAARVVHAGPLRYGGWIYGCAFHELLSEEELRLLLA
jgi:hypothetical protein